MLKGKMRVSDNFLETALLREKKSNNYQGVELCMKHQTQS